jgi:Cu-Zn family superoxide dismutase
MRSFQAVTGAALGITLLCTGCSSTPSENLAEASPDAFHPATVMADLSPTTGNTVRGTVTLTSDPGGVRVVADLEGLTPGEHGFHIHDSADCSGLDAASPDVHFSPAGGTHGAPDAAQHHAGDLGNLIADAAGKARMDRVATGLSLEGPGSVVGHAIVVHGAADDLVSQPDGRAGAPVACGVLVKVDTPRL